MHFVKAKTILSPKNGMNIYRGCSHGCVYCDSRSRCYNMNHDFEDCEVKINAPQLLEIALRRKRKKCMIGTGSMSDPYAAWEKELQLTKSCLEIIEKYGFGAAVLTKSDLVLRDIDLLRRINTKSKCVVQMTLTTADENLCGLLEPEVCTTIRRYKVLKAMQEQGIPTVVWLCPLLPFINDSRQNLDGILEYCFDAGVKGIICFGIGTTLRQGSREYFYRFLDKHFPGMKEQYVHTYGQSYNCLSPNHPSLMPVFHIACQKAGVMHEPKQIFQYLHSFPEENIQQLSLFK